MSPLETLNRKLFLAINGPAGSPQWLVDGAIVLAQYLIYLLPLLLAVLWLRDRGGGRATTLKAVAVVLVGLAANQLICWLWPHPRPVVLGLGHTWISHGADPSFPSDHLTVVVGAGLTLLLDDFAGLGGLTLGCGLLIAWARVFLGLHFPFDMLGSVVVAGASYVLVSPLWSRFGDTVLRGALWLYRCVFARFIGSGRLPS